MVRTALPAYACLLMVDTLEKCRLKNPIPAEITHTFQSFNDGHPQLVHNAPRGGKNNWLSSELFQKISRRFAFFIFVGKGFESQWLCLNIPLRGGTPTHPGQPDSLKIR
jgi:hypothetical protein